MHKRFRSGHQIKRGICETCGKRWEISLSRRWEGDIEERVVERCECDMWE